MTNLQVVTTEMAAQIVYGLWMRSNDKTFAADIDALSAQFHAILGVSKDTILPFFVLSKDYEIQSKNFQLFIGGTLNNDGLESFVLPAGTYAKITLNPKLHFLWGAAIGQAKRYFYNNWLPQNAYRPLNMEYELHTEMTTSKQPSIEILFAIAPLTQSEENA